MDDDDRLKDAKNVTITNSQGFVVGDHGTVNIHNYPKEELPPLPEMPEQGYLPEPGPAGPGWRLPFNRNALFTGREADLRALARALFYGQGGRAAVNQGCAPGAIQGQGGMGKTQLAVELAYRYGRYLRGVHWLNAEQARTLSDLENEIIQRGLEMGVQFGSQEKPAQVEATLRAWTKHPERLVVVDNLDYPELLDELLPALGGVRVLITTRRGDLPDSLALYVHRLWVFTAKESRAYLRKTARRLEHVRDDELDGLAEWLGGLPLALHVAGSYLNIRLSMSVAEYEAELERLGGGLNLPDLPPSLATDNPTRHERSLYATFLISWNFLEDSPEDRAARYIFQAAGYCVPNEPIGDEVFAKLVGKEVCDLALTRLDAVGLVERGRIWLDEVDFMLSEQSELPGISLHPLVAEAARKLDQEAGSGAAESALPALGKVLIGSERYLQVKPHLGPVAEALRGCASELSADDLDVLAKLLVLIGDRSGAQMYYEQALAIRRSALGEQHPDTAISLNNLGDLHKEMRNLPGARTYYEQALAIRRAVLSEQHPDTATSLNNLGALLQKMGDRAGARTCYEQALAIRLAALGEQDPATIDSLYHLGDLLKEMGDLLGARTCYEQALANWQAVLGEKDPHTVINLYILGDLLREMNDLDRARAYYEQALAIRRAALNEGDLDIVDSLCRLAELLQKIGDLDGAWAYCEQGLDSLEARPDPDDSYSLYLGDQLFALQSEIAEQQRDSARNEEDQGFG